MRALVWHGKQDIRCETVPDPKIEQPRNAIVRVTSAICGSDRHVYDHLVVGIEPEAEQTIESPARAGERLQPSQRFAAIRLKEQLIN
jgi:hypothetical protein